MNHVRNHVGENGRCRGVDDVDVKEHIGQGREQKDDARQPVQEVNHGVHEAQALGQGEALFQQRVVQAENLDHAAGPADALTDVRRKRFGRKARSQRLGDAGRLPAAAVELERRVRVFGHCFHSDAADFFQGAAAHHGVGAAEHDRIPRVVALLDVVVKERVLKRHGAVEMQVLFKRIG